MASKDEVADTDQIELAVMTEDITDFIDENQIYNSTDEDIKDYIKRIEEMRTDYRLKSKELENTEMNQKNYTCVMEVIKKYIKQGKHAIKQNRMSTTILTKRTNNFII